MATAQLNKVHSACDPFGFNNSIGCGAGLTIWGFFALSNYFKILV